MKRCICAALALTLLLTLCACGRTGTGSGSAVGGTSSAENIFEQLVQEKVNIEDFSCKKAYTVAKKCLEKQDYDNAAVWFYIAQEAGRRTRDDEGCTQDARQMYEAMLGQDDAAAWMFVITARELDMELDWDRAAEYNEMLIAVPEDASEKAGQSITLARTKMYRLEQAKQYGTLSVASVPLRRWEEDGFAPAEPLRPGETELELTWEDDGRRASPDGTWEEIWYGDSVAKITRTDLEGNTIVTEYYEGEPETTEESDALCRVHIRTNHRTPILPHGSLTASHINTGLTSTDSFRLNISTMRTGQSARKRSSTKTGNRPIAVLRSMTKMENKRAASDISTRKPARNLTRIQTVIRIERKERRRR